MLHGTKTVIKHKIGLLNLAEELGNVSKACQVMRCPADECAAFVERGHVSGHVLSLQIGCR
mgnify:CR=1 FL=1